MNFENALKALKHGKKIKRLIYSDDCYFVLEIGIDGEMSFIAEYPTHVYAEFDQEDLLAEDWEIVDEN